jgi:hypothetical protein
MPGKTIDPNQQLNGGFPPSSPSKVAARHPAAFFTDPKTTVTKKVAYNLADFEHLLQKIRSALLVGFGKPKVVGSY